MSVHAMGLVWQSSSHSGTDLLMLLAIADFADDDGRAYPSVATLARKCRMTPRNVNHILPRLVLSGELSIKVGQGPRGTNLYRIDIARFVGLKKPSGVNGASGVKVASEVKVASGVKNSSLPPEAGFPQPLKRASDKPSENRHEPAVQRTPSNERGSRLPGDWRPSDEAIAFCLERRPDLDPAEVAERFRDYWLAQPGAKGRKSDWAATWRYWVRNERRNIRSGSAPASPSTELLGITEQLMPL